MSRQVFDLESILQHLVVEHRKLLKLIDAQQIAMRGFALDAMDDASNQQEACRLRIAKIDGARRLLIAQVAKQNKISGEITLSKLAELFPQRAIELMKLRDELKRLAMLIQSRTHVAGKLAHAVLGHLNTVVRLVAGAVERAGVYTKHGIPKVSSRIGVMEAVG